MPELNNNFIKGRMNKDLDERLVSNGEYRDALNIEVSTSEGSNVGTVQTIKGNTQSNTVNIGGGFTCVASVADEKNDALYWFVTSASKDMILKYHFDSIQNNYLTTVVFVDTKKNVLKFDSTRLITGLSILDDLLFWTDNFSEPKVINIPKSIEGTPNASTHTKFIVKNPFDVSVNYQSNAPLDVEEKHITLIKPAPLSAPHLFMSDKTEDRGVIQTTVSLFSFDTGGTVFEAGSIITIAFSLMTNATVDFRVGDIVLATNDLSAPSDFTEHQVRLLVESIDAVGITFSIQSISNDLIPTTPEQWKLNLEQINPLFELKFPRFAIRYKYQDGEYSAFSPFTKVAFLPGPFDYQPKKGFNLGMTNRLRVLKIQDFVIEDSMRPDGVIEIDILYKESNSPTVYTLKTITTEDEEFNAKGSSNNGLTRGEVIVTKELIHAVVPSNQLLRPYDNVPRLAKALDVTANRIIFGNYVQNYDLIDDKGDIIDVDLVTFIDNENLAGNGESPATSLKSLRTYQVGIIYRDKYGRETPVLASKKDKASQFIKKKFAKDQNKFRIKINNKAPKWADSFKFYVKETSNEYYNLCMDRWYPAEDGNVWLSFPSAERNKVDEDTYLILKKQHDSDTFVEEEARFKVIAIENEAPDAIKLKRKSYGTMTNNTAKTLFGDESAGGFPEPNAGFVYINKEAFDNSQIGDAAPGGSHPDAKKYIRFLTSSQQTKTYEIEVMKEVQIFNTGTPDAYYISIDGTFGKDASFTTRNVTNNVTTIGTGVWADRISGLQVEIFREEEETLPEHKGRFFVKVFRDSVFDKNVAKINNETVTYKTVWSEPIYHLKNPEWRCPKTWKTQVPGEAATLGFWSTIWDYGGGWYTLTTGIYTVGQLLFSDDHQPTKQWWRNFGSHWFLDNVQSRQNDDGSDKKDMQGLTHQGFGGRTAGGISRAKLPDGTIVQRKKLQLAFAGIFPSGVKDDASKPNEANNHENRQFHNVNVGVNANPEEKTFVDHITKVGTVFKWALDPSNQKYVIEDVRLNKSGYTKNNNGRGGFIKDELTNYDSNVQILSPTDEYKHGANKRIRYEIIIGQYEAGGLLPGEPGYIPGAGIPVGATDEYNPMISGSMTGSYDSDGNFSLDSSGTTFSWNAADHYDNPHSIEILEIAEDQDGDFTSTNPAIWETEPKETTELDIYHEASNSLPITLDARTNETYVPVGSKLTLPTTIEIGGVTHTRTWTTNVTSINFPDLQVTAFNDNVITINGRPTYVDTQTPTAGSGSLKNGDIITFVKPNGGLVTGTVILDVDPTIHNVGNSYQTVTLSTKLHEETYFLDYHNCFAFGNGVESNRIRDDFNAVLIDKGPRVSATLAEPYKEERKKNGLIYSGIYNSISGVNNLNQFIQAEKITKDLSPRFGSIQKLFAMDGNLNAFCEDKVVRVMANKDAVFNADGKPQLIATDRVLGQAMPYAGEYGISKNPESFANRGFQSFFTDKARGAVLRLSGNGITPISDNGMKDYFHDNLRHADRLIGSYDEKKALYNITLASLVSTNTISDTGYSNTGEFISFVNLNPLGYFHFDVGGGTGVFLGSTPHGSVGDILYSYTNYNGSLSYPYGQYDANNNHVSGSGTIPLVKQIHIPVIDYWGTNINSNITDLVTQFNNCSNGIVYLHYQVQAGISNQSGVAPASYSDTGAPIVTYKIDSITTLSTGAYNIEVTFVSGSHAQIDTSYFWWSTDGRCDVATDDSSDSDSNSSFTEVTVSYASRTNGWVSFKSWIQENGLSLTGNFYTFKNGNLYKHHDNEIRNNFYNVQYESSVDVLLNQGPTSVKSFQTLNYSGSQARITKNIDTTNFDNQYYNNKTEAGWYAGSIETDIQSGSELEFKPKENKWFATMMGLATYFNSDSDNNVDTKEFTVQGIDFCSTVQTDPSTATNHTLKIQDDPADH